MFRRVTLRFVFGRAATMKRWSVIPPPPALPSSSAPELRTRCRWSTPSEVLSELIEYVPTFFVPVAAVKQNVARSSQKSGLPNVRCRNFHRFLVKYRFYFDVKRCRNGEYTVKLRGDLSHKRRGAADIKYSTQSDGEEKCTEETSVEKCATDMSINLFDALQRGLKIVRFVPPVWIPFDEWAAAMYHLCPSVLSGSQTSSHSFARPVQNDEFRDFRAKIGASIIALSKCRWVEDRLVSVSAPLARGSELALPTFIRSNVDPKRICRDRTHGVAAAQCINPVTPLVVLRCHYSRSLAEEVRRLWRLHASSSALTVSQVLSFLPPGVTQELSFKVDPGCLSHAVKMLFWHFPEFFRETPLQTDIVVGSEWSLVSLGGDDAAARASHLSLTSPMKEALQCAVTMHFATRKSSLKTAIGQLWDAAAAQCIVYSDSLLREALLCLADDTRSIGSELHCSNCEDTFLSCVLEMGSVVVQLTLDGFVVCPATAAGWQVRSVAKSGESVGSAGSQYSNSKRSSVKPTEHVFSFLAVSFVSRPELLVRLVWSLLPTQRSGRGVLLLRLVSQLPAGAREVLSRENAFSFFDRHRDVFRVSWDSQDASVYRRSDVPPETRP